jgi:Tfp pilus assembly protein PilV
MKGEEGSVLAEVLVSAIMLVITAVGVFTAFEAGHRSSAEERHRAQAEGLAQADLTRMRTMRISDLSNLHESKVVVIEETPYTVKSAAEYETDKTGTASCEEGIASADYIQIRSTVTWPSIGSRAPVVQQSLVAPPNGSVSAESGSLAIQIDNAESTGIEGVGLTGTGAGTFNGETGTNGCAVFGDLPAGNYTLALSGPSLVDPDGEAPQPLSTSVVEESTNTLSLQYDEPGEVEVEFQTRVGGELVPSEADSVIAFNSGMSVAKVFGSPGNPSPAVTASSLFPFTSAYSIYAGACEEHNPSLAGESVSEGAVAEPVVQPGATSVATIELPALHLTAWSGTTGAPGEPVEGAEVKVEDTKCTKGGPIVRTYTTNSEGGLPDPGLPFSTYDVCVSNGIKRVAVAGLEVPEDPEALNEGTTLEVFLGALEAEVGECP